MSLNTPREFFLHELGDMLNAETIIKEMLPELAKEAPMPELADALTMHHKETADQIGRINQVFKLMGEKPQQTTCYATAGLRKEHESLHKENPSPDVLALGIVAGGSKTEHYEIASYGALIQLAKALGETEAAQLLSESLAEEEFMAAELKKFGKLMANAVKASEAKAA